MPTSEQKRQVVTGKRFSWEEWDQCGDEPASIRYRISYCLIFNELEILFCEDL